MKNPVLTLCVIIISISFSLVTPTSRKTVCAAASDAKFARISTDDAFLYADAGLTMRKFILPKSYYVRIVSFDSDRCRVTYMDGTDIPTLEGYVKTVDLLFVDETPVDPYPSLKVTASVDEVLFADDTRYQPKCVISRGAVAYYIGEIAVGGESLLYVYASGNVGYVRRSSFNDFSLPDHPSYETSVSAAPISEGSVTSTEVSKKTILTGGEPAQVIIIALLIVGVLCLLFLLFNKERKTADGTAFYKDDE